MELQVTLEHPRDIDSNDYRSEFKIRCGEVGTDWWEVDLAIPFPRSSLQIQHRDLKVFIRGWRIRFVQASIFVTVLQDLGNEVVGEVYEYAVREEGDGSWSRLEFSSRKSLAQFLHEGNTLP